MTRGTGGGARDAYDVVVVGGGPAGAAAAVTLARAARRVLLVEALDSTTFKIGETLPPAARTLLADLGVWDAFAADGHLPCYGILSAWGSPRLHDAASIYDPHGRGWHLDRARFDALLRDAARLAGADVLTAATPKHPSRAHDGWTITLTTDEGQSVVRCRWLVDATGRRGALARGQGAEHRQADRLVAFFMTFGGPRGDAHDDAPAAQDSRTLVEAAADGWWYTALLPSRRRVVAYFTDADLFAPQDPRTAEAFLSLLNRTEHVRAYTTAGGYSAESAPKGAAAHSARLDNFAGDGWLAAGDAALSFDPLSSQGILNALFTGMEAGRALDARLAGDADAVTRYARRLATIYEVYLRNLADFYSFEERWTDHPFWRRRRPDGR